MLGAAQTVLGGLALVTLLAILWLIRILVGGGWAGASIALPGLGLIVSPVLILLVLIGVEAVLVGALVLLFK
jgi:hypothetical protein